MLYNEPLKFVGQIKPEYNRYGAVIGFSYEVFICR